MFSNLSKVYWPEEKITKGQMIAFYDEMAPLILPHLKGRPQVLHRFPHGINGASFIQKNVEGDLPDYVHTKIIHSETENKDVRYLLCQNQETLLYLANLGCIELHVWNSREDRLRCPDYIVIDLDPLDVPFSLVVEAAQATHSFLSDLRIQSYCRTSGATGLHIYIPLGARYAYKQARTFARILVTCVNRQLPKITSIERQPAKRRGQVYLDYLQNSYGQTLPAVYSLRALPGAPVATPLHWDELNSALDPSDFNIFNIHKRIVKAGDLWQEAFKKGSGVDLDKTLENLKCRWS